MGAFFVALTLCIVSFSCTAPFVGALLVAAADGAVVKPLIGMLGFGVAFALPFTIFGMFPAMLKNIPKSGGWMNVVKVTFAIILIMFGMKFLTTIDVDLGLYLISREIVVSVWIACLAVWGLYMLGKLPVHHEEKTVVGAGRMFAAILAFSMAIYLSTAFLGAKFPLLEGLLPEHTDIQQVHTKEQIATEICGKTRFAENKSLSSPVSGAYFDLKQARDCAQQQGRPLLLYFKGHSCANCKKMQNTLLKQAKITDALQNKFVVAVLYTDDKTELPQAEWYVSDFDGKTKKTLGQQNLDYLMTNYSTNSIPFFAIEDADSRSIMATTGYTADEEDFLRFLSME
jgi:thiol:disulfide interchange protein DsbD